MSSFFEYLKAAFLHPVNWMGFGLLALIALVSFNPMFFILAAGWEVAWVGGAPMVPAFRASIDRARELNASELRQREDTQTLAALSPDVQQRFKQLKSVAASIRENYKKGASVTTGFLDQISTRVDGLMQRYLELLKARDVYQRHTAENSPHELKDKLASLDASIAEADAKLAEVKAKQREILQKRYDQSLKAEKDFHLLDAQLATIEELVHLLSSQAVSISQPEEITSQLDSIMSEIEVTESTMMELQSSVDTLFDRELEKPGAQKRIES